MYCQECGTKLPATAKFCSNCGMKVNDKSNKKLLVMIAGVFVALAVVIGSFFVYLENRTLYYLTNPEMFFGECTNYYLHKSAPGESYVELVFESETDCFDKVLKYAERVDVLDASLEEYENTLNNAEGYRSVSWRVAADEFFWHDYSLGDKYLSDVAISYKYDTSHEKYKVSFRIRGYQNCEFIDINPYERADSEGNTVVSEKTELPEPTEVSNTTERGEKPSLPRATVTPKPTPKPTLKPKLKATATPMPTAKIKATAIPTPTVKLKATATPKPKPQLKATATPAPSKTQELIAQEIDTANAVQPPKNAFQDFATWSMGAATTTDAEQRGDDTQYLDYEASQETIDAYIEMLKQNGFTLVDDYFFQYQSDPFASWGFNCDYVPKAGKVEVQYENSTCHLCISTAEKGEYTFHYSSDLTQYDLGLRMDGSAVNATAVKGPSAGAGLYRTAEGVYTTTDGRLSASMNKATVIRDGKTVICDARSEIKSNREWLWVDGYYRNEAICFGLPKNYTMEGDLYQLQDLKREKYYHDADSKSVASYTWGNQPLFVMSVNELFTGPLVTGKNLFEEVTVRVMHYEEGEEAVYYIYAKTFGTPSEIEVLCAVGLEAEEKENDAENAIVLSVGDTHTLNYYANVFGAKAEVYSWSISGGDGIYADGTGSYCKVTAMKKGTGKVTVTCRYTVEVPDILTGFPTTEQRSKSKTWYFRVE